MSFLYNRPNSEKTSPVYRVKSNEAVYFSDVAVFIQGLEDRELIDIISLKRDRSVIDITDARLKGLLPPRLGISIHFAINEVNVAGTYEQMIAQGFFIRATQTRL